MSKTLTMVGRAEKIDFPEAEISSLPAKIDTGAYRSSVWATSIREENGKLYFHLLGPEHPNYTGREICVEDFEVVEVENSFGHKEERYSVYMKARLAKRIVRTNFTLADRAKKTYPVLIGRKMLRGKYIVNVAQGSPISDEEKS